MTTLDTDFFLECSLLKSMFLVRGYPEDLLDNLINEVSTKRNNKHLLPILPDRTTSDLCNETCSQVVLPHLNGDLTYDNSVNFITTFSPQSSSCIKILKKNWNLFKINESIYSKLGDLPRVTFRKGNNLKSLLEHASTPHVSRPGMSKCENCNFCKYVEVTNSFSINGIRYKIRGKFNCNSTFVVYLAMCKMCPSYYVGKTERRLRDRLAEFKAEVLRKKYDEEVGYIALERAKQEAEEHKQLMAWNDAENKRLQELSNPGPKDGAESSESSRLSASALQRRKRFSALPNLAKPRPSIPSAQPSRTATPKSPQRRAVLPVSGNAPLVDSLPQSDSIVPEEISLSPSNGQPSVGQQLSLPHLQTPVPQVPKFSPYKKLGSKDPATQVSLVKAGDVPQQTMPCPLKERARQESIASDPEPSTAPKKSQPVSDRERIHKAKKLRELLRKERKKEKGCLSNSSIEIIGVPWSSEKPHALTTNETVEEEAEDMEEDEDGGPLLVPRVKVAEDGSIIIDEEGEFKEVKLVSKKTDMFFIAISMVGTDFSLIGQLFPHRERPEIKNKFKREERVNAWRIDKAFNERKQISFDRFARLLEKVLAEEEKKQKTVKTESATAKPVKPPRSKKGKNTIKKKSSSDTKTHETVERKEGEADLATAEKENEMSLNVLDPETCHGSTSVPSIPKKRKLGEKKKKQEDKKIKQVAENSTAGDNAPSESKHKEKEKAKPSLHEEEEPETFIGGEWDYADGDDDYDDDEFAISSLPEDGEKAKQPDESTSSNTVEDDSQKRSTLTCVRPAAVARSRLQKIKPNIVRAAERKALKEEHNTEDNTEKNATQDAAAEKDHEPPPECELEV
ncbi:transcription factor TFIIIB component B'' homolog [Protopterus annectens]|uniref:transcription factor TFIIIB component B'' homolog n=1 Tax=Protopterus annectens TaxID=7888 RepID=UPI001CFB70C6|nr:transcription factor TFIIIB component B'' homolog [Protopterus annectens]